MGVNNIVRSVSPKSIFESALNVIDATSTWEQGDILVFDDTANLIKKPAAEADCSTMLGIARVSITNGKLVSPYQGTAVDAAQAIQDIPGPVYGVIASLIIKTGDSINPGDLVYADPATSSRGVTVSGTKAIGIYQGKAIATAAAGTLVEILIGARHPADALKF